MLQLRDYTLQSLSQDVQKYFMQNDFQLLMIVIVEYMERIWNLFSSSDWQSEDFSQALKVIENVFNNRTALTEFATDDVIKQLLSEFLYRVSLENDDNILVFIIFWNNIFKGIFNETVRITVDLRSNM